MGRPRAGDRRFTARLTPSPHPTERNNLHLYSVVGEGQRQCRGPPREVRGLVGGSITPQLVDQELTQALRLMVPWKGINGVLVLQAVETNTGQLKAPKSNRWNMEVSGTRG